MPEPSAQDQNHGDPARVSEAADEAELQRLRRLVIELSTRVRELERRVSSASQELRWLRARAKALERELGPW